MKTGKVVKSVGGVFYVFCDGRRMRLFSRKKIRLRDEVIVGDNVLFDEKERTIEKVCRGQTVLCARLWQTWTAR